MCIEVRERIKTDPPKLVGPGRMKPRTLASRKFVARTCSEISENHNFVAKFPKDFA